MNAEIAMRNKSNLAPFNPEGGAFLFGVNSGVVDRFCRLALTAIAGHERNGDRIVPARSSPPTTGSKAVRRLSDASELGIFGR